MDYTTPALVGASSVAGIYVARYLRGSEGSVDMTTLAMAAGISAVSAAVAPMLSARMVCPHSPAAPLIEAGASSGVAWSALAATAGMDDANKFLPVQFGAHLVGTYARKYWTATKAAAAAEQQAAMTAEGTAPVQLE